MTAIEAEVKGLSEKRFPYKSRAYNFFQFFLVKSAQNIELRREFSRSVCQ